MSGVTAAMTLADTLRRAEKLFGGRVAILDGDDRATYAQFADKCRRVAGGLRNLGIAKGDRVATLMMNGPRYLEVYFAVPGMGAVLVPLNNRHSIAEHRYVLRDCGVKVLIVDENFEGAAHELTGDVERVVRAPREYDKLANEAQPLALGESINEDDLASLFYTGGTTGAAKGVMLSHRNLAANAMHTAIAFAYTENDTYLHSAPMFHLGDGGSTYAVTWVGGRHTFCPSFETDAVISLIEATRTTVLMMVPTMINSLISHPRIGSADLSSIRMILHGAAPISEALLTRAIKALGCSFTQAYGMTEAAPVLTALTDEETLVGSERLKSAGREVVGVETRIVRPDGAPCAAREVGEVIARGPNIMQGYWNKPAETAQVLRDGWYWTGDLAYRDEGWNVYLVDRAKDMIISGGENVYSTEVENALAAHPAINECAVIGLPDPEWGERVHAVVVFRDGMAATLEEIRAFCAQSIARYKCPKSMESVAALPRSGAGKVLKRDLRGGKAVS